MHMAEVDVILSVELLDHWQALILSSVLKVENGALGGGLGGGGQLSSFVCLTLAKDRFSFLSLKSQDNSRHLKLFLAQPLAQTPGACEMGVGQRGGTNTGIAEKRPPPHLLASLWLPSSWVGESAHFLFTACRLPGTLGLWWPALLPVADDRVLSELCCFFLRFLSHLNAGDSLNSLSIPHLTAKKRTNLLALYI